MGRRNACETGSQIAKLCSLRACRIQNRIRQILCFIVLHTQIFFYCFSTEKNLVETWTSQRFFSHIFFRLSGNNQPAATPGDGRRWFPTITTLKMITPLRQAPTFLMIPSLMMVKMLKRWTTVPCPQLQMSAPYCCPRYELQQPGTPFVLSTFYPRKDDWHVNNTVNSSTTYCAHVISKV